MITFNKTTVTIPFFRVGVPAIDLAETVKTVTAAARAQKRSKP